MTERLVEEMFDYFRKLRDENLAHASKMEAGEFCTSERRGGKMVDTTTEWAAELRRRAASLDQAIRAHDKRNSRTVGEPQFETLSRTRLGPEATP